MAVQSRLMAENGKVVYESLSARSDLSNGKVILRFYFQWNLAVFVLRGFLDVWEIAVWRGLGHSRLEKSGT